MGDRLAISASFSVLMMATYVLFGANVERTPLSPSRIMAPGPIAAARSPILDGPFLVTWGSGRRPFFARD